VEMFVLIKKLVILGVIGYTGLFILYKFVLVRRRYCDQCDRSYRAPRFMVRTTCTHCKTQWIYTSGKKMKKA
jgi:hypothetical protein